MYEDLTIDELTKLAESGDAHAQVVLGSKYYLGDRVVKNLKKSLYWYQKAAEQGDSKAQYSLGTMYEYGEGTIIDLKKATYWYQKASEQNFNKATIRYALIILKDNIEDNIDKTIELLTKLSDSGDGYAAYNLASIYEVDTYHCYDLDMSFMYYKKAKDLGIDYASEDIDRVRDLIAQEFFHSTKNKDVFISYCKKNNDVKNEVVSFLENKGFNTVDQLEDISMFNIISFNEILDSIIRNTKSYILLVSGNTLDSFYEIAEIGLIFKLCDENKEIKSSIIPIILNYKVENGVRLPFDTLKAINELEDNNPLKKLLDLSSQFTVNGVEIDFKSLENIVKLAIEHRLKIEYKEKILSKFSTFNAALSKVVDNNTSSNIISSTVDFNNGYINRPVYDVDDNAVSNEEILKYPISLIYGEGGIGKTLYLKNIIRKEFKNNNYIFYISCKSIVDDLENKVDFIDILKKESFDYFFPYNYKMSMKGFSDLFVNKNKIIILIDALDEISETLKINLIELFNKFYFGYQKVTDLKVIFTSRNSIDSEIISYKLNTKVTILNLKELSDEDITTIFDNISLNYNKDKNKINNSNKENLLIYDDHLKKDFFISLKNISNDIKKNPLLLSNLIYVYIVTHKIPTKQFEIIQKSNDILIFGLEKERNVKFKYDHYINGDKLTNLLGYLTMKRSKNSNESTIEIFKHYFEIKNLLVDNDDSYDVADAIYTYLSQRSIIIRDNVSHEIFRDYYTAIYIYNHYFVIDEDEDFEESYIKFKDGYETKFDKMIKKNLSNKEFPWPNIATDLLTKLDFEIFNLDTKQILDEDNLNYDVFNTFLTKTLKDNGYSEDAIKIIKGLTRNELLYFTEFIKKYIN